MAQVEGARNIGRWDYDREAIPRGVVFICGKQILLDPAEVPPRFDLGGIVGLIESGEVFSRKLLSHKG